MLDPDLANLDLPLVAARAVHFTASLLVLGTYLFDRLIVVRARRLSIASSRSIAQLWNGVWPILVLTSLLLALLSGAVWFGLVAIQMSDDSPGNGFTLSALTLPVLRVVWFQTQFGQVWQLRLLCWIGIAAVAFTHFALRRRRLACPICGWIALLLAGVFVASLGWAGHGATEPIPRVHLAADVSHLLLSAAWPLGLIPLLLLLWRLRRGTALADPFNVSRLINRFSLMSLICVVGLVLSGLVNSYCLIGSWSALRHTVYGQTMLIKLAVFAAMLPLGAVNLLLIKPRLARSSGLGPLTPLRISVGVEVALAIAVMVAVAVLGQLPPGRQ